MTIDSKDQMAKKMEQATCGGTVWHSCSQHEKKNHYKETNVPKGMGSGRMNPAAETGGLSIKRMEAYQGGR